MIDTTIPKLDTEDYSFLHDNIELKDRIMLLRLCGSYLYGTNDAQSDIDLRGICKTPVDTLLGFGKYECYSDTNTDTSIFTFNKAIQGLKKGSPSMLELITEDNNIMYSDRLGRLLLKNRELFISKYIFNSLIGYCNSLENEMYNFLANSTEDKEVKTQIIYSAIETKVEDFNLAHKDKAEIKLRLSDGEIETSLHTEGLSSKELKETLAFISRINDKINTMGKAKSNKKIRSISKQVMMIVKWYMNITDIMTHNRLRMHREEDIDLLMSIKHTAVLEENSVNIKSNILKIKEEAKKSALEAYRTSKIKETVDMSKIDELVYLVNRESLK